MAATETLSEGLQTHNSHAPRHGVLTLYGYDIRVNVDRGHLLLKDGISADRSIIRLPRIGHGLKRLVIIGADGFVSLAALRWLADQNAAFVMLERNGKVLCVTGPVLPSDAKLRRAQALAAQTGVDVTIARELTDRKLAGQECVARDKLQAIAAAQEIADYRLALAETENLDSIRSLESRGAGCYWAAWRNVEVFFPKKDLARVPEHWQTFGTRKSPLSGSPRLATNPANAMLNYLYALLESEARLAASALGLDPGLAFLHVDTSARDSLACDLMEAVRPLVDAYVLDWILTQPLRREWFYEQRNGNCRLMAHFAVRLAETTRTWSHAVAPLAEWVTQQLWSTTRKRTQSILPPTRLTQTHRRKAKSRVTVSRAPKTPIAPTLCRGCGKTIIHGRKNCTDCAITTATEHLVNAARTGRAAARSPEARVRHAESERRHANARSSWDPSSQPSWLTKEFFSTKIQPLLANVSTAAIRSEIGVSRWYASKIRQGQCPHPRHWQALAQLVKVAANL